MRRVMAVIAVLAMLALAGCSLPPEDDDPRPVVLTTFTVLADIARNVAGDRLRVESITKVGAEIHGYEPTPRDVGNASDADLILDNGLGLEAWFQRFVAETDVPHVVLTENIEPIDIASDAYAGQPNPHAWMSPLNVVEYVGTMVTAFSELDPAGAETYEANGLAYADELRTIHDDLITALETVPIDQRVLVTCEGAFSYLARDAGLTEAYIWPVNAEQQATPSQITETIEIVSSRDVPAVFCESTVSDGPMHQVVEATGTRLGGILYVDSLSDADGPVPTYLDLIRYDVDLIVAGLTGGAP